MLCQKGRKVTNGGVVGNVKMQKFTLRKSEWKEFINKKKCTISTLFKFRKDFQNFEILNILANFTKGVVFSGLIKC